MSDNEMNLTPLELEFREVWESHITEIQAKCTAAAALLDEAVALSEKYGIPFRPEKTIMFCEPSYIPESMKKKFPDLEYDFVCELTNAWSGDYDGW